MNRSDGGTILSGQAKKKKPPPLIAHVIYRLDIGGLENGLVNLINNLPANRYRHAIICMTESTDFQYRIKNDHVICYSLNKKEGKDFWIYFKLWKLLKKLKPDIVHTRNLSALEAQLPALFAGVRGRVHSEHGREGIDMDGRNIKYNFLRRIFRPFIHKFIPLSSELNRWLQAEIKVPVNKIIQIYNGVDTEKFYPTRKQLRFTQFINFTQNNNIIIGTVGRMAVIKDQLTLVRAFIEVLRRDPKLRNKLRLVMIGDGPLYHESMQLLMRANADDLAWLPGYRDDIDDILHIFDIFILPSISEGVSNTILEAMACGLPVIANRVGGNPELIVEGETGILCSSGDHTGLADAVQFYMKNPEILKQHGAAGHARVIDNFSIGEMVRNYMKLYDSLVH